MCIQKISFMRLYLIYEWYSDIPSRFMQCQWHKLRKWSIFISYSSFCVSSQSRTTYTFKFSFASGVGSNLYKEQLMFYISKSDFKFCSFCLITIRISDRLRLLKVQLKETKFCFNGFSINLPIGAEFTFWAEFNS